MTIKEFYTTNYPTDVLGAELKEGTTFIGLLDTLFNKGYVCEYIGMYDSVVRERLFMHLAEQLNKDYSYVYNLWLYRELRG